MIIPDITKTSSNNYRSFFFFFGQWKDEKDELTSTIQELKEDAQTLNAKFVEQQEETLKQSNEYQVTIPVTSSAVVVLARHATLKAGVNLSAVFPPFK